MIDSLTSANHRDFSARYRGTWGFYLDEDNDKRVLVKVDHVDHRQATFVSIEGGKYVAYADKGLKFEFIPVNKGYFNGDNAVYWLERHPARQWQRGIHENNTVCERFLEVGTTVRLTLEVVLPQIFRTDKTKKELFDVAVKKYVNGDIYELALSTHFAVNQTDCCFFKHRIGTVNKTKITLDDSLVAQELRDTIRRNNLNFEVDVNE